MKQDQEAKEMITRVKIQLQKQKPFFAYLLLNLNYIEKKEIPTMAVDNHNNLYYNPDWVRGLSEDECSGVITHELMHVVLNHLTRTESRDALLFNYACDVVVNHILISNDFQLPKGGLIPSNNEITFCNVNIKDIDKKSAEVVYDEITSKLKKTKQNMQTIADSRFDEHITDDLKNGKDSKGNPLNEKQIKEIKDNINKWKRLLVESATYSRTIGQMPNGMSRCIDKIFNEKINWRNLLYRFITNSIPIDFSYAKPSKRSLASKFYMPHMKKEELQVFIAIDSSGSVQQSELSEFLSEMVSISKSFSNIKMYVVSCDCAIQEVLEVSNGSVQTVLDIKIKGGGGTSVKPIADLIENDYPSTKILIYFTDGFIDHYDFNSKPYKTIWVVSQKGSIETPEQNGGEVIKLSE